MYDRSRAAEPTEKQQEHWEQLAKAECERQRKARQERAALDEAEKRRMMERFRYRA